LVGFGVAFDQHTSLALVISQQRILVVGETVIEAPMALRSRYTDAFPYRHIFQQAMLDAARWIAAPKPQLPDDGYDEHADQDHKSLRNLEPVFDAANVLPPITAYYVMRVGRLPLVAAWVTGFVLQGQFRAFLSGTPHLVPFTPMTSAAFIVFTLYMVPDPATTPLKPLRQALFGFSVAMVYGALQMMHKVFGLFFALLIVCAIRGLSLHIYALWKRWTRNENAGAGIAGAVPAPAVGNAALERSEGA